MTEDNEAEIAWQLDFTVVGDLPHEVGDRVVIEVDAGFTFRAERVETRDAVEVTSLRVDGVEAPLGVARGGRGAPLVRGVEPAARGRWFDLTLRVLDPDAPSLRFGFATIFGHALSEPLGDS